MMDSPVMFDTFDNKEQRNAKTIVIIKITSDSISNLVMKLGKIPKFYIIFLIMRM